MLLYLIILRMIWISCDHFLAYCFWLSFLLCDNECGLLWRFYCKRAITSRSSSSYLFITSVSSTDGQCSFFSNDLKICVLMLIGFVYPFQLRSFDHVFVLRSVYWSKSLVVILCLMLNQVLHMDRNDYYGGESTSLNLIQVFPA